MGDISKFDLISGDDIFYKNICYLHPPRLDEIRNIGFNEYDTYIKFLSMDANKYLSAIGVDSSKLKDISNLSIFDIFISNDMTRKDLLTSLSFFISGELTYNPIRKSITISKNNIQYEITRENYSAVIEGIFKLNNIVFENEEEIIFKDESTRELYMKMQKAKAQGKLKSGSEVTIADIISVVSCYSNGYNLTNIWLLTINQLYDQFYRLNTKLQFDVFGTRWAAWGKDEFDFTIWYKNEINKKET